MTAAVRSALLALAVLLVAGPGDARADELTVEFDIFVTGSDVAVWIDLRRFLGAEEVEQLRDGIDVLFECRLALTASRRFFGDRRVGARERTFQVRFRPVAEDFVIIISTVDSGRAGPFVSLTGLNRYLEDSVIIPLAVVDSLDPDVRYALQVTIACITLTDFNLAEPAADRPGSSESPVRFLFRKFLGLTGYGRREYSAHSRSFSLPELAGRP
ncbi:MAG TPA: DUF4390 domain-containing protein [Acidobacteriota bacterium]|nr:DUF4390 domain-containing protein [Acidobacteriota bacterium]